MFKNILLLDGISNVPIGKNIYDSLLKDGENISYVDLLSLPYRFAYKLRRALTKVFKYKKNGFKSFYYPKLNPALIKNSILNKKPDLIIVIGFFHPFFKKQLLEELKKDLNFKMVLFDTDSANFIVDPYKWNSFLNDEIVVYDKIFSFSKKMASYFAHMGCKDSCFFPYGAEEVPILNIPKNNDICFIGTPGSRRLIVLEELKEYKINIFSKKWKPYKKFMSENLWSKINLKDVWGNELNIVLQSTKIVLNINNHAYHSIESGVNLRIFEALMSKCFLITEHSSELAEIFAIGEELETYRSIEELRDKLDYYLTRPDRREEIALRGYQKVIKNYTWDMRSRELLKSI